MEYFKQLTFNTNDPTLNYETTAEELQWMRNPGISPPVRHQTLN